MHGNWHGVLVDCMKITRFGGFDNNTDDFRVDLFVARGWRTGLVSVPSWVGSNCPLMKGTGQSSHFEGGFKNERGGSKHHSGKSIGSLFSTATRICVVKEYLVTSVHDRLRSSCESCPVPSGNHPTSPQVITTVTSSRRCGSLLNRRSFSAHIAPTASALMYTCFPYSAAKQSSSLKFNRFSPTNCEFKDGFKPMFQNPKQGSARSV
jgi:hypothetical protein